MNASCTCHKVNADAPKKETSEELRSDMERLLFKVRVRHISPDDARTELLAIITQERVEATQKAEEELRRFLSQQLHYARLHKAANLVKVLGKPELSNSPHP